jgi:uncharacterized membrane protein
MQTQEAGARGTSEQVDGAGLARGLGWFSVGLGLAELAMPRMLARAIGVDPRGRTEAAIRAMGARELANGLGILARPERALPLWARVAGDAIDLALLGWALGAKRTHTQRLVGAIASVVGVAALDVLASRRTGRAQRAAHKPIYRTITIYQPAADVYAFWRDFEQHPRVIGQLASVVDLGGGRTRWTSRPESGDAMTWETQIAEDVPGERIELRMLGKARLPSRTVVTFRPVMGGTATEVCVEIHPGPRISNLLAKLAGPKLDGDLRRLKQVLETGEVTRSDASIHRGPHPSRPSRGDRGGQL